MGLKTIDGATVRYTLDGTEPTASSPAAGDGCDKFRLHVQGQGYAPRRDSRVLSEKIAFSKATCKPITANQPVNRQYEYKGVSSFDRRPERRP